MKLSLSSQRRTPLSGLLALEPRLLFDGAALAVAQTANDCCGPAPEARADCRSVAEDDTAAGNALCPTSAQAAAGDVADRGNDLSVVGVAVGVTDAPVCGAVGEPVSGQWGTLTIECDGTWTYRPSDSAQALADGQTRQDVFTYTVIDECGRTDNTTITITVCGTNDAPTANADSRSTTFDRAVQGDAIYGGVNGDVADHDIDRGDVLGVVSIVPGSVAPAVDVCTAPLPAPVTVAGQYGSLTIDMNGRYTYTPDARAAAIAAGTTVTDVFSYTIGDGQCAIASSSISIAVAGPSAEKVNAAPIASSDSRELCEDDLRLTGNVLGGPGAGEGDRADSDPQGDPLSVISIGRGDTFGTSVTSQTVVVGEFGTLTISPDGSYQYTYTGLNGRTDDLGRGDSRTDRFTYVISDSRGGSNGATLTVLIEGSNDAPSGADARFTISEDLTAENGQPLRFAPASFGFSDPDRNDVLGAIRIDSLPASGTLALGGVPVTVGQVIAAERIADLTYVPAPDANNETLAAAPFFTFTVQDAPANPNFDRSVTCGPLENLFAPVHNRVTIDITPVAEAPAPPPAGGGEVPPPTTNPGTGGPGTGGGEVPPTVIGPPASGGQDPAIGIPVPDRPGIGVPGGGGSAGLAPVAASPLLPVISQLLGEGFCADRAGLAPSAAALLGPYRTGNPAFEAGYSALPGQFVRGAVLESQAFSACDQFFARSMPAPELNALPLILPVATAEPKGLREPVAVPAEAPLPKARPKAAPGRDDCVPVKPRAVKRAGSADSDKPRAFSSQIRDENRRFRAPVAPRPNC